MSNKPCGLFASITPVDPKWPLAASTMSRAAGSRSAPPALNPRTRAARRRPGDGRGRHRDSRPTTQNPVQ
jgi:hypothetical protein